MPTDSKSPVPPLDIEGCAQFATELVSHLTWDEDDGHVLPELHLAPSAADILQRLAAFLSDELPGLRIQLAQQREAEEDLWEERRRMHEALFQIVAECGESDEWTSECDVVLRRAFLPLGQYRAARSVLPPDREPANG